MRYWLLVGSVIGAYGSWWLLTGCGSDNNPTYGNSDNLHNVQLPGSPPPQGGSSGGASGGSQGGSTGGSLGGSTGGATGGSTGGATGGAAGGAGGCTVTKTWSNDVYPLMKNGGAYQCSAPGTCHSGNNPPTLDVSNAGTSYGSFSNGTAGGKPLVTDGQTDKNASGLYCILSGTGCGLQMPQGGTVSAGDLATVADWIACGSHNN